MKLSSLIQEHIDKHLFDPTLYLRNNCNDIYKYYGHCEGTCPFAHPKMGCTLWPNNNPEAKDIIMSFKNTYPELFL